MPICPHCGTSVPEGQAFCGNCGAEIPSSTSNATPPNPATAEDMQIRLKKATRRAELLGYAAVGLGLAILAVIIIISLL